MKLISNLTNSLLIVLFVYVSVYYVVSIAQCKFTNQCGVYDGMTSLLMEPFVMVGRMVGLL